MALEREIETYDRLKSELQPQTGRFALIRGDGLIGTYNFRTRCAGSGLRPVQAR